LLFFQCFLNTTDFLHGFGESCPSAVLQYKYPKDVGDDDVFMTLNLPQEPLNSRSSSDSSTTKGSDNIHRIHYPLDKPPDIRQIAYDTYKGTDKGVPENYSYVQLTGVHEYTYPIMDDSKSVIIRQPSLKKPAITTSGTTITTGSMTTAGVPPDLSMKPKGGGALVEKGAQRMKIRCRHCHELYSEDENRKGACEYAPDRVKRFIDGVTCIGCAQCVSYHCASDAEGDCPQHPCECGSTTDENCVKRWLCLTFLSIFVPCLWFYPPLRLCHYCGVRCGTCGGKHHVLPNS